MKKILVIFLLLNLTLNAQSDWRKRMQLIEFDSKKHERIYEISTADYQVLQLIENVDKTFSGTLTNSVVELKSKKIVTEKSKIQADIVEKLMCKLSKNDIETIKDCRKVNNCLEGLDGTTYSFSIFSKNCNKSYSFLELKTDDYNKKQKTKNRIQAIKLLNITDEFIDLDKEFHLFLSKLPKKKYLYNSLIITLKK